MVRVFCYYSGLKYKSAKRYLDSLCEGEAPRLRRYKESGRVYYEPIG